MKKQNRNTQGRRNHRQGHAFTHAPRQGTGETLQWSPVQDVETINLPNNSANGTYAVIATCDCNGWAWNIQFAGANVSSSPFSAPYSLTQSFYAERNGQFSRIAQLWNEYRIDGFSVEFQPVMGGGYVNYNSSTTVVDEASALQGTAYDQNLVNQLASYKNFKLHTGYEPVTKRLNLRSWMGQTQDTAWLPTQDAASTAIIRQRYSTPLTNVSAAPLTPSLAVVSTFNFSGSSVFPLATRITTGTLIFHAHYTFRLRKALSSNPFADRILLFEAEDGSRHRIQVEEEMVEMLYQRQISMQTQEEESDRELVQIPEVVAPKQGLTQSALMQNVMEMFAASKQPKQREVTLVGGDQPVPHI